MFDGFNFVFCMHIINLKKSLNKPHHQQYVFSKTRTEEYIYTKINHFFFLSGVTLKSFSTATFSI